jgi:SAM-dependent methyltransferase
MLLTPARRRGVEILDDPSVDRRVRAQAMADVARSNALFGGTRVVRHQVRGLLPRIRGRALLLDVGTGSADIAAALQQDATAAGVDVCVMGLDLSEDLARGARQRLGTGAVVASALHIPLADRSVDVIVCSQLLHHFAEQDARALVAELHRVSRGWVLISDLRRSWLAAGGFWVASALLGFHAVTRSDGVVSVLRGFTVPELAALVRDSTGVTPRIFTGLFWRVGALWRVSGSEGGSQVGEKAVREYVRIQYED